MSGSQAPHCGYMHLHEEVIQRVNQEMPEEETLFDLAELFKVFGDSTRIRILYALFQSEMCVCDIAQLLGMTQSAISHQLQTLKKSKLVKYRRQGKTVSTPWQMPMSAPSSARGWSMSPNRPIFGKGERDMRKSYKLIDLDCANCAAKMEDGIRRIDGVLSATVSFMSQKLTIETEDGRMDEVMQEVVRVCKKVEPDCEIMLK